MLIALLADIHANREALTACLADARARRCERLIFLGDLVGYGADPEWVVATVIAEVAAGAAVLLGNHDAAVGTRSDTMGATGQAVIEWTRVQLGSVHRGFLASLPLTLTEGDRLFVHADASAPSRWNYVTEPRDVTRSLRATEQRLTFCGHVHKPMVYSQAPSWQLTTFRPFTGVPVPLLPQRRWLAVLGSVGQPRDGNPAASYGVLDTTRGELTYLRVPYDVDTAAAKILEAGLPPFLADRLHEGR
jgi:diadenosine tetraphosphatase ApaH/serine/threonine PP2A family protein phosphatase